MNKNSVTFKTISIAMLSFDLIFLMFFIVSFIMVLAKTNIFQLLHLIAFLVFVALNLAYIAYLLVVLMLNKAKSK